VWIASHGDAHPQRLPRPAALVASGDALSRDKPLPALVFACEHEHRVVRRDLLTPYIVFCAVKTNTLTFTRSGVFQDDDMPCWYYGADATSRLPNG
jgi:hypothetical protein